MGDVSASWKNRYHLTTTGSAVKSSYFPVGTLGILFVGFKGLVHNVSSVFTKKIAHSQDCTLVPLRLSSLKFCVAPGWRKPRVWSNFMQLGLLNIELISSGDISERVE